MNPIQSLNETIISNLDFECVKSIVGDCKQLMVYGWHHCHYNSLISAFEFNKNSFLEKVFNFSVGNAYAINTETLEGREIEKLTIQYKPEKRFHRICKNGITNLLLENYKRIKKGEKIIPLLFCVDVDENRYNVTSDSLSSKQPYLNNRITNSELRRCYKLHSELQNSPLAEFQELSKISEEMFKFVKVSKNLEKAILLQLPPIWKWPNVSQAMQQRAEEKASMLVALKMAETSEDIALREFGMASLETEELADEKLKECRRAVNELRLKIGASFGSGEWRTHLLTAVKRFNSHAEIKSTPSVAS